MSTMWSLINKTARGDVLDVVPRVDAVSFKDNSRTDISDQVLSCNLSRDFRAGLTGQMRLTKDFNSAAFWIEHAINPTLRITTVTGTAQVKLGLLTARSLKEDFGSVSLSLNDVLSVHKQPQLHPFNTAPEDEATVASTTTPEAALAKLRELTSASQILGALDHRGFEPTTLLNPNPEISADDQIAMRSYPAGSDVVCELERLLNSIDWRPPWTTRRGLLTSERYCSACDATEREKARELPFEVIFERSLSVSTNLLAPNVLRVLDSNGDSVTRELAEEDEFSPESVGRVIPHLERARNPAGNIEQFWVSMRAPRRKVSFSCAAPGVFWHRDVFKLANTGFSGVDDKVCVVSRWSLDLISGVYKVEADLCD